MSWFTDPQLFIYSFTHVYRITKGFGINPVTPDDFTLQGSFNFSQHLSMANNKESDFNAFKATFPTSGIFKFTNSQGWMINWDLAKQTGTWSREEPNSPFWSLPGITATKPKSVTEQTLEKKVSDLEEKNSYLEEESKRIKKEKEDIEAQNATLIAQANRDRGDEKQAIDKRVLDLEAENAILKAEVNREREEKTALIDGLKREEILVSLEALRKQVLDHCCGGAGGGSSVEGPWITGHTVPSNWVPFGDLDVQPFSKNIPLMITKATGGLKFGDDNTTNVQADRLYGGVFPIVVVDVAELNPNREEARFDPDVWSRYNNAGISYAARKPFTLEMSMDAHKTC